MRTETFMPLHPEWSDILLRLLCTLIAGFLIGLNRSEHGKPAGLRTTMLVCLAASLSMILGNLLLDTGGKTSGSFVQFDVMRLPLGILTGMGFIGAGTILRRGSLVVGVTTAATLWFITMLGFCFGAGQYSIGFVCLALALGILWLIKLCEDRLHQDHRATLTLITSAEAPTEAELRLLFTSSGFAIDFWSVGYSSRKSRRKIRCVLEWRAVPDDSASPLFIEKLREAPGVQELHWVPAAVADRS
jgi:putative Mg2+ transporter-C (MgtC) family protein